MPPRPRSPRVGRAKLYAEWWRDRNAAEARAEGLERFRWAAAQKEAAVSGVGWWAEWRAAAERERAAEGAPQGRGSGGEGES
jgi:hypothetical protein